MRLAVLLSLAWLACGVARSDDEHFRRVDLEEKAAYIVPEAYAAARKADFEANIPGPVKIEGFWTPGETDAIVADRVLRVMIHKAMKDPTLLFPDLAPDPDKKALPAEEASKASELSLLQRELELVSDHYNSYVRQYVGVIIRGQRLIFCNYTAGTEGSAAQEFLFTDKFFVDEKQTRFLQCRFDPEAKECSNVSLIGRWRD